MTIAPVVRSVTVNATAPRAFTIFTERIGKWWPVMSHSLAGGRAQDVAFIAGRLVETADDGTTQVWGSVTEWSPPTRLAFTWALGGGPETSVAVDFEDFDGQTRVVLTHSGWEALGDQAVDRRANYEGEQAWGWILGLFAAALPQGAGTTAFDVAPLRQAYESIALALERDGFVSPPSGEWDARQVAGHVITNAELVSRVVDDVRRGGQPRLHGPDDHAPDAIGRCAGAPFNEVAAEVRRAAGELVARCSALTESQLQEPVQTYIEHRGQVVVDGEMTVDDLLAAQVDFHLPAHVAQIGELRKAGAKESRRVS